MNSSRYLENVFEFLDAPNEYYYSPESKRLYIYYNGTGAPPADGEFVATGLQTLVSVQGSLEKPVKGVTISGVHFRDAAQSL